MVRTIIPVFETICSSVKAGLRISYRVSENRMPPVTLANHTESALGCPAVSTSLSCMSHRLLLCLLISLAACRIGLAGSPDAIVVFNEIQYNPAGAAEDGEWVELFNQMGIKTDLSGWRIKGIDYTFPPGTVVDPGSYVVVAKNPRDGQLGPFTGSLNNAGERLELINQGDRLMDELNYNDSGRWPVEADGSGATLAKRNPYFANKPNENWRYSEQVGGTPGTLNFPDENAPPATTTIPLFDLDTTWRYNEAGDDLGVGWAANAHPIGGNWESGQAVLASENGLAQPINTTLDFPGFNFPYRVTYYFEKDFELSAAQAGALQSLPIRHLIDDGAVFYLNGTEVLRTNLPGGVITAATRATDNVEAVLSSPIPLPPGAAVAGTNRLSVEVHQTSGNSSDVVFGAELKMVIEDALPGTAPQVAINEIPPATEADFWIELVNTGGMEIEIGGMTLSVGGDPAREYSLPAQSLAASGLLLLDEATLGFRPADTENIFLYDSTKGIVLDGQQQTGRLRGRASEKDGDWLYPGSATPGAPNVFAFRDEIVISEIAYNPPALSAIPDTPATFESVELFGFNNDWRYNDGDENLASDWAGTAHAVGGNWKSAAAPIGRESGILDQPLVTDLIATYDSSTVTYYFEREFDLTVQQLAGADSMEITHQIDDGAIFYLNGVEVGTFNLPSGAGPETQANPSVGNATIQTLAISADALVAGSNRISVEVHQSSTGSSDLVFGVKLDARFAITPFIPGAPFRNSDNQWLEIANRSGAPVDLGGWNFGDGISFVFPFGTSLAAGEHACIARNAVDFSAAFPGARLLGEFDGTLSRSGEHLLLRDANTNPACEMRYFDGGRWPDVPDGGGASLELRDLYADPSNGASWAASDETDQTGWKTYTHSGVLAGSRGPDTKWSEFNIGLLDEGELLIDDISVIENGSTQKLSNTDFSSGGTGWRFRGTHRRSEVIDDPEAPGNKVLRLVATGGTGHMSNQIETTLLNAAVNGRTYDISFRARWVGGSNQLHTRLYFNRMPHVTVVDRPQHVGTPSTPNSRSESNIGPTFTGTLHSPAVPAVSEAVKITTRPADPDGLGTIRLFYSVNGGTFQNTTMGIGSGGLYEGTIPGQAASAVVQFYLQGSDSLGASASFPATGPESRALFKVDDGLAATNGQHNFRIVVTNAERDFIHEPIQVMSNDRIGATIIDRENDIYYDVKLRLKGSQRARNQTNRVGFNMRFGSDQLYRGIHKSLAIDRSEGVGQGQLEILFDFMIANSGGIVSRYYDFVKVITPQDRHTRSAVLQMARYDNVFLDSQFENGSDGNLYEYELLYTPNNADANGFKVPEPDGVVGVNVSNLGDSRENYRWFFLKKNNREADDFAPIIAYNKKFSQNGAAFEEGLEDVVDVDAWLRGMAYAVLSGAGDNAGANSQHNGMYYARPDGRVMFLPHDMDFAFDAGRTIFANSEVSKLTADPARRRIYLGHLHDIISSTYNNSYMSMWTSHLQSLDSSQPWSSHLNYITSRSNNVLSQINSQVAPTPFSITTANPHTVNGSSASLVGDGWVDVRSFRLAGGGELDATWTDNNSWQLTVPVALGSNLITIEALNFSGEVIGIDSITVNNTSSIEPASAVNLAISEIMYHASAPTPNEISAGFLDEDAFEFIELMNIGSNEVDLDGAQFTSGINYALPATIIPVGGRVIIARDRSGFLSRHPGVAAMLLPGEYGIADTNKISNSGELIVLIDASSSDIRRFTYDDNLPWPTAADGPGFSMVLIAPDTNPDHALADNWRSSTAVGGNPGSSDSLDFSGDPNGDDDDDGLSNFLEYALGVDSPAIEAGADPNVAGGLRLTFSRNLAADDVLIEVQSSTDLKSWTTTQSTLIASTSQGDGTAIETWAIAPSPGSAGRLYLRVAAISR